MRRMNYLLTVILSLVALTGCSKEGPTGPAGPAGPPGPGTRTVFSGTITSAATSTGQTIALPGLQLSDFPLVGVYVQDSSGDWAQMNLVIYDSSTDTYPIFEVALLRNGSITLFSTQVGQPYRIVVVT